MDKPKQSYRQAFIEHDQPAAAVLFKATCSMKQQNHLLFMKRSFVEQSRGYLCGPASIAAALNHMNILSGLRHIKPQELYQQHMIYRKFIKGDLNVRYGVSMLQLVQVISTMISFYDLPYVVDYVCVKDVDVLRKRFTNDIRSFHNACVRRSEKLDCEDATLSAPPFIVLDNHKGGHWSPIINVSCDMRHVFVADVAAHRNKPHWVGVEDFIPLMLHRVKSTNLPRGYIRIHHRDLATQSVRCIPSSSVTHSNVYIRLASKKDALTLSRIQVAAWKQTYDGIIDAEYLNSARMSIVNKYSQWMSILRSKVKRVLLLCRQSQVLGYCTVGKVSRHSVQKMTPVLQGCQIVGELYTLYLSPQCPRRQGCGGTLFDAAAQFLRNERGDTNKILTSSNEQVFVLWMLGDNKVASCFYKKHGGVIVNDHQRAHFGGKVYRYTSMAFPLQQP